MILPDILCFSSTDWSGIWGSRQQIMRRLAQRGHRVLYVERPIGVEHWMRYKAFRQRKALRWRQGLHQIEENLWIFSLPVLLPGRYFNHALNNINQRWTADAVQVQLRRLKFDKPILWLYTPESAPLIGQFNEQKVVYHCIDEWTAGTNGRKKAIMIEQETPLIKAADVVFANSPPLFEKNKKLNPNTVRLPSGVDFEFFAQPKIQADHPAAAHIPHPRLAYSGHVNERLDYKLLIQLAEQRPNLHLVLVGGTYPWTTATPPLAKLLTLPNVHYLGKHPYSEMPQMLHSMDLFLIPYIDDERGRFRSPLKLYEYLAVGRPIVSLSQPEIDEFANLIEIATRPENFIAAVDQSLINDSPQQQAQRQAAGQSYSWDRHVDTILRSL